MSITYFYCCNKRRRGMGQTTWLHTLIHRTVATSDDTCYHPRDSPNRHGQSAKVNRSAAIIVLEGVFHPPHHIFQKSISVMAVKRTSTRLFTGVYPFVYVIVSKSCIWKFWHICICRLKNCNGPTSFDDLLERGQAFILETPEVFFCGMCRQKRICITVCT